MHPDGELIAYITDELAPDERARVASHVQACEECRASVDDFREILGSLRAAGDPPPVDWGRFQAELRGRMEAAGLRRAARPAARRWWRHPVWAGMSLAAAVAVGALALTLRSSGPQPEMTAMDETLLGVRLPLLEQYAVIERLDMLEDLELIRNLDSIEPTEEG